MGCIYCGNLDGRCQLFDVHELSELNPEGADEQGFCCAEDDEDPSWCQSYESDGNDWDDEVCDYCGEPLGFCASDCETRDENFEE